jgi:hypothetical protein
MSLYDFTGKLISATYQRVVQVITSGSYSTPSLYDGLGNEIKGLRFQEAFERDENGDVQPTEGAFFDILWEEDSDGNKMPRDIKWWLDSNYNLIQIPPSGE